MGINSCLLHLFFLTFHPFFSSMGRIFCLFHLFFLTFHPLFSSMGRTLLIFNLFFLAIKQVFTSYGKKVLYIITKLSWLHCTLSLLRRKHHLIFTFYNYIHQKRGISYHHFHVFQDSRILIIVINNKG